MSEMRNPESASAPFRPEEIDHLDEYMQQKMDADEL